MVRSKTYPKFFKVFLPETSFKKMLIPPAFISHLDKKLSTKTILMNRLKSVWQTEVVYREDGVFFMNGWEHLVEDNSLAFGDFIVFQFDGDRTFQFRFFQINGCEKVDVRSSQTIERGFPSVNAVDEEGSNEDSMDDDSHFSEEDSVDDGYDLSEDSHYDTSDDSYNGKKKKKPKPKSNRYCIIKPRHKAGSAVRTEPDEGEEQACRSFVAIIRPYHIDNNYMIVPVKFARTCDLMVTKTIKLWVSREKKWRVKFLATQAKFRISKGWATFASDNHLKVGDICSFDFIRDGVLKVDLSRC